MLFGWVEGPGFIWSRGNSQGVEACKGWSRVGVFARGRGAAERLWLLCFPPRACDRSSHMHGRNISAWQAPWRASVHGTAPIGTPRSTRPPQLVLGMPPTLPALGRAPRGGYVAPAARKRQRSPSFTALHVFGCCASLGGALKISLHPPSESYYDVVARRGTQAL